jgi:hypothetical protein
VFESWFHLFLPSYICSIRKYCGCETIKFEILMGLRILSDPEEEKICFWNAFCLSVCLSGCAPHWFLMVGWILFVLKI